ncbi:MAG TPA: hypothetical protein VKT49_07255 [Bryobacteraceae bacterium]|nr:hypothetical protein [Bryobacteraceae bacterium]
MTVADRLVVFNIQIVGEAQKHSIFARENCIALVERTEAGFGSIGSTGIMTEFGLAYLVWRGQRPMLVGKSGEQPAGDAELAAVRRFSEDLKSALGL